MEAPGCFREDEKKSSQAISWLKVEWWIPELKRENRQNKLFHILFAQRRLHNFLQHCFPNIKWHEKVARLKTRKKCIRMKIQKNFFIIFHPENLEIFSLFFSSFFIWNFFLKQKLKERWKIRNFKKWFFYFERVGKLRDAREILRIWKRAVFPGFPRRIKEKFGNFPTSPWAKTKHWKTI